MGVLSVIFPVVAAALRRGEHVLVQQRAADRAMGGLWEFPGGKVEPGERPEAALCRELHEELGITVNERDLTPFTFATAPHGEGHLLLLLYVCDRWSGTPAALDAAALCWVTPVEMRALPMPPADLPFVDRLAALIG